MRELGIEHDRVFADTGWEHDSTYGYVEYLEQVLGPIVRVKGKLGMEDLVRAKGMFPSRKIRFCTQELKVFPIRDHLLTYGENEKIVNAVGIRKEESAKRATFTEWEPWPPGMEGIDIDVWRPILEWKLGDVIAIHHRHGVKPNPLYMLGASRVGCWPCIFARKEEVALIADRDPARIDRIRALEAHVQGKAEARYAARGETFESLGYQRPTFFQSSGPTRGDGQRDLTPIDGVVEWAKTGRGGKQYEFFNTPPELEGCMRWGLCETPAPEEPRP